MDNLELLARLLKKKDKMKYKYLAKRILEQGKNESEVLDIKNKKQCYDLLLLMFDNETKDNLKKIDAIVRLVSRRIEEESGWKWNFNREFTIGNRDVNRICFSPEGFTGYRTKELAFLQQYSDGLDVIHNMLMEKDFIMAGNYQLNDEKDRDLVELLIRFLGYSKDKENDKQKLKTIR